MADNSSRKFKFISPGVFIDEIDQSELPAEIGPIGPVIIGRTRQGPGMKPVTVSSFQDFVETFGAPVAGAEGGDIWRGEGLASGPTYASYAAQAWLQNSSPVTMVRLLGEQSDDAATATGVGCAGWYAGNDGSKSGFAWSNEGATGGGAFGLFVWPSGTTSGAPGTNNVQRAAVTGALAAIIYADEGKIILSGTLASGSDASVFGTAAAGKKDPATITASFGSLYKSNSDGTLTLGFVPTDIDPIESDAGGSWYKQTVSLTPSDPNFIRNVLNTNPTIVNDDITTAAAKTANQGGEYWLGESYERSLTLAGEDSQGVLSLGLGTSYFAAILPMANSVAGLLYQHDQKMPAQRASTGFFIGQDLGTDTGSYAPKNQQQLFRFEALSAGIQTQEEIKISIANIKAATGEFENFGSFSVFVRKLSDVDSRPVIIERYDNLNLNPASPNYIAVRIGDQYEKYDPVTKSNRRYGRFPNKSNYIRVEMNPDLDRGGLDTRLIPFGVFGPLKSRDVSVVNDNVYSGGKVKWRVFNDLGDTLTYNNPRPFTLATGSNRAAFGALSSNHMDVLNFGSGSTSQFAFSGSIRFPSVPLRQKSTWGGTARSNRNIYWGAWTNQTPTSEFHYPGIVDCIRVRPNGVSGFNQPYITTPDLATQPYGTLLGNFANTGAANVTEISWVFSLDDISGTVPGLNAAGTYTSGKQATTGRFYDGARKEGKSLSAVASFTGTLDAGYDRFTTVLAGGSDGWDITERDPLRLSGFPANPTEANSYQLETLKRAINIVSDADVVPCNAIAIPGVTENTTTSYLLEVAEDRADTLAVIDIQNVYTPDTENSASAEDNNSATTVGTIVSDFQGRNLNNSYGATYAPWLLYQDTISSRVFWGPPSIAAIGVLSTTDSQQAPWFAPAGFQRGGLSDGNGGIPVLDVSRRYSSDDRDDLYEVNINPIAKFPAEGIVFWGQKTLQQTRSALDRINVRRLMIFLKREISFIASRLLFGPNTQSTWDNFIGQAEPLLTDVKMRFGIEEFRLILDDTTTTPDLIDRNIINAKLLIKPTRAVEFFAIDFVITNSGASFED